MGSGLRSATHYSSTFTAEQSSLSSLSPISQPLLTSLPTSIPLLRTWNNKSVIVHSRGPGLHLAGSTVAHSLVDYLGYYISNVRIKH